MLVGLAAVATVAVGLVLVLVAGSGDDDDAAGSSSNSNSSGAPAGIAHVHGLGVDPGNGTLYVASHFGVYQVPQEGTAERVGPVQDTMGFTVVGADHFVGSGHPGPEGRAGGQPGNLGLIESTDGGGSWEAVSLSGEVDFHALDYAHDQVYGWASTSGELMVSDDMRDWESRSTLQLADLAVDPTDPDRIVATTAEGVQVSDDGGRNWEPVDDAPELLLVDWDADSGLWGVDPSGTVHHTTALDRAWDAGSALPGPPQALLADGTTLYAAAQEDQVTGIYTSTDAGETWNLHYRDDP